MALTIEVWAYRWKRLGNLDNLRIREVLPGREMTCGSACSGQMVEERRNSSRHSVGHFTQIFQVFRAQSYLAVAEIKTHTLGISNLPHHFVGHCNIEDFICVEGLSVRLVRRTAEWNPGP